MEEFPNGTNFSFVDAQPEMSYSNSPGMLEMLSLIRGIHGMMKAREERETMGSQPGSDSVHPSRTTAASHLLPQRDDNRVESFWATTSHVASGSRPVGMNGEEYHQTILASAPTDSPRCANIRPATEPPSPYLGGNLCIESLGVSSDSHHASALSPLAERHHSSHFGRSSSKNIRVTELASPPEADAHHVETSNPPASALTDSLNSLVEAIVNLQDTVTGADEVKRQPEAGKGVSATKEPFKASRFGLKKEQAKRVHPGAGMCADMVILFQCFSRVKCRELRLQA